MSRNRRTTIALLAVTAIAVAVGFVLGGAIAEENTAEAASGPEVSPTKARDRDFYAPNSEDLAPDEMRLVACGTGMPTARPKQAASCWLLELGNGDKFLFDLGTGSA